MCRSCKSDAPKWGHGIKIPVKDLPRFFESQQSWNFEQKIYGRNVEVFDNVRPTLTGRLGCRDTSNNRRENQFLVREIFHCPGWRYGCSPRLGCSGKRKNCYALCKVAIYSDNPEVGVVQYAGNHGSGNPSNPVRHRPTNRVRQFIRHQHLLSGATPAQLEYAIRQHAIQEGLDINDPRHVPTSAMIRHIVKRARNGPSEKKTRFPKTKKPCHEGSPFESLSQIVRPLPVKAESSPIPQNPAPLSPALLSSLLLPQRLFADILLNTQLKLNLQSLETKKAPDESGSVGSLSPGSPSYLTCPTPPNNPVTPVTQGPITMVNQLFPPPVGAVEDEDHEKVDKIWRPYLTT